MYPVPTLSTVRSANVAVPSTDVSVIVPPKGPGAARERYRHVHRIGDRDPVDVEDLDGDRRGDRVARNHISRLL